MFYLELLYKGTTQHSQMILRKICRATLADATRSTATPTRQPGLACDGSLSFVVHSLLRCPHSLAVGT